MIAYLKIGAASGQDNLVGLQVPSLRGKRDIDQRLVVQQTGEHGDEVGLVVVPTQAILLHRHPEPAHQKFHFKVMGVVYILNSDNSHTYNR